MDYEAELARQEAISDLADKFLDEALKTEPFSEGLCNWAISKAEREVA